MRPQWIDIRAQLVSSGELHIRTGLAVEKEDGDLTSNEPELLTDHQDMPVVPGSGIKGSLRRSLKKWLSSEEIEGLLGANSEATGAEPTLWIQCAFCAPGSPASRVSIHRNAIDRKTGSVEGSKLFLQPSWNSGIGFEWRATFWLTDRSEESLHKARRVVGALKATLINGLPVGGQSSGPCKLFLKDDQSFHSRIFLAETALDPEPFEVETTPSTSDDVREPFGSILLRSRGPFIVTDPDEVDRERGTQVLPLGYASGMPLLRSSSLKGVLRKDFAWWLELERLNGNDLLPFRSRSEALDRRFEDLESLNPCDNQDYRRVILEELSPVERLFGIPGFAGLLHFGRAECVSNPQKQTISQIAIDRVTGGVLGSTLHNVQTWVGADFRCDMRLKPRVDPGSDLHARFLSDWNLFLEFMNDPAREPLFLGHGKARGWGKFDVELEAQEA